jgi:hypothetical protein
MAMTGVLEAIGIGLLKAVSAKVAGAALRQLTQLRGVPMYGSPAPKPLIVRASDSLLAWKASDRISDDDFAAGAEAAQAILERVNLPTAGDFPKQGGAQFIADRWIRDNGGEELMGGEASVCRRVLVEVIEVALLDPEYRDRLTLDLLLQLSRQNLPQDPGGLSLANRAVARWRTQEVIGRWQARRSVGLDASLWPSFSAALGYSWIAEVDATIERLAISAERRDLRIDIRAQKSVADESYSSVRTKLMSTDFLDLVEKLRADVRKYGVAGDVEDPLRLVDRDIRWLRGEAATPSYRAVLPIAGSWGSGKTDLIASISSEMLATGVPTLFVGSANSSLVEALLNAATRAFGRPFETIDELTADIREHYDFVLIAIDNLDIWVRSDAHLLRQFRELVEETTADRAFRWVVSSDPTALGDLFSREDDGFWRKYGYAPDLQTDSKRERILSTGWLDLDELVVTEAIGRHLIEKGLPRDIVSDLNAIDSVAQEAGESPFRLLARPRAASLLIDVIRRREREGGDGVVPADLLSVLTDDFFVEEYWRQGLDAITTDPGERERLLALKREVAENLFAGDGQPVNVKDLQAAVFGEHPDTRELAVAKDLIGGLVGSDFLRPAGDELLSPSAGVLWGKAVLEVSDDDLWLSPDLVVRQMRPWQGVMDAQRRDLGRYVLRARFSSIGQREDYLWVIPVAWRRLLGTDSDDSSMWFAALAVPAQPQAELAKLATERPDLTGDRNGVFALLYWCRYAPDGVWSMPQMLKVLSTTYHEVRTLGLGTFLLRAADRALASSDLVDRRAFDAALKFLGGSDESGVGSELAVLLTERLTGRRAASTLLPGILEHFRSKEGVVERLNAFEQRTFDVELLESGVNRALEVDFSFATAFMLHGAWADSGDENLNGTLRRASRRLVGNWYRADRARVTQLVGELLEGKRDDLEASFFIVRHTVTTRGHAEVRVDPRLSFAVETFDRRIDEFRATIRRQWVEPFLKVNLRSP